MEKQFFELRVNRCGGQNFALVGGQGGLSDGRLPQIERHAVEERMKIIFMRGFERVIVFCRRTGNLFRHMRVRVFAAITFCVVHRVIRARRDDEHETVTIGKFQRRAVRLQRAAGIDGNQLRLVFKSVGERARVGEVIFLGDRWCVVRIVQLDAAGVAAGLVGGEVDDQNPIGMAAKILARKFNAIQRIADMRQRVANVQVAPVIRHGFMPGQVDEHVAELLIGTHRGVIATGIVAADPEAVLVQNNLFARRPAGNQSADASVANGERLIDERRCPRGGGRLLIPQQQITGG